MTTAPTERRRSVRRLCSHLVTVVSREGQSEVAVLEDISPEGAAVAMETPLEAGEQVDLVADEWRASASVRYCIPRENDCRLGLAFTAGCRWEAEAWQPDHLFLPPPRS